MAFALSFASSYFSTITPQGGSQNVIFSLGAATSLRVSFYRRGLANHSFLSARVPGGGNTVVAFGRAVTRGWRESRKKRLKYVRNDSGIFAG